MVRVVVSHGDLERAMKLLKKKMQRELRTKKMKVCFYEKPSEKRVKKAAESERRRRKLAVKRTRMEE